MLMAWLYWDPSRDLFTVPIINRPIGWYGLFFVTGILFSYWIVLYIMRTLLRERHSFKTKEELKTAALSLTDRLTWFVVIGIILGARLGHVFFYDWPYFSRHPEQIFNVTEGISGLASHGGGIGILAAIGLYRLSIRKKFPELTFWTLADIIAVPTALAGMFIRIGNFFNQEILGTPTQLPWAVIFGHPADHSAPIPRHPVQLYEAITYLLLFFVIFAVWKFTKVRSKPGFIAGLFFILLFTARIFLELFKTSQSMVIDESTIQMGQYLSVPFILLGVFLIWRSCKKNEKCSDASQ
jgi:phosphatidylglycerol---prolipoprotein diacylglyceryl transferase